MALFEPKQGYMSSVVEFQNYEKSLSIDGSAPSSDEPRMAILPKHVHEYVCAQHLTLAKAPLLRMGKMFS